MQLDKRIAAEAAELARQFWAEVGAAFEAEVARIRATLPAHATPPLAHRPRDDETTSAAQGRAIGV